MKTNVTELVGMVKTNNNVVLMHQLYSPCHFKVSYFSLFSRMAVQSIGTEGGGAEACSADAGQLESLLVLELSLPAETNTERLQLLNS